MKSPRRKKVQTTRGNCHYIQLGYIQCQYQRPCEDDYRLKEDVTSLCHDAPEGEILAHLCMAHIRLTPFRLSQICLASSSFKYRKKCFSSNFENLWRSRQKLTATGSLIARGINRYHPDPQVARVSSVPLIIREPTYRGT
jgi:hypothetical protein